MAPKQNNEAAGVITLLDKKLKREEKGTIISFSQFLEKIASEPTKMFRNVFQMFHDMIYYYIEQEDDYNQDPESINYKTLKCEKLFIENTDTPFFSDLPLANRLVRLADSFKEGTQQNKIYIFIGPPGSGKSTFLNTLLRRFEEYTRIPDGLNYEVLWRLDLSKLDSSLKGTLEVPCPSHDHPILMIPKAHRQEVLENLVHGNERARLFFKKEYEWVFKNIPCTICSSIYDALSKRLSSPAEVFSMLHARRYVYNRRVGDGITVYNPGDAPSKQFILSNEALQKELETIFKDSNLVRYIYSRYARINNGVFALMDVKGHNQDRLLNLHGIISEGVHKIEDHEENVNSLFLATMNPEDKDKIKGLNSFQDRITEINVNYILNFTEEVNVYYHAFGKQITRYFLPGVLENFAKIIISSRLNPNSEAIKEWISNPSKYEKYCDEDMLLLKMSLYSNVIPSWLADEDRKTFDKRLRRMIFSESEKEGRGGFSGRESINIFNDFFSTYKKKVRNGNGYNGYNGNGSNGNGQNQNYNEDMSKGSHLITMDDIKNFFAKHADYRDKIPRGFIDSIIRLYDYNVMEEIKEALFKQNEERISKDIQNYLFASNYDIGARMICPYTGEFIEVCESFYETIEKHLFKRAMGFDTRKNFRAETAGKFAITLQDMQNEGLELTDTQIYKELYGTYMNNLRENIFQPFLKYTAFENAIKEYGTEKFEKYDSRTKEEVTFLIRNLVSRFHYSSEGAREVCLYIINKNIA